MRQFLFNMANRVIAEITSQATAKTRHARTQCHFETLLVGLNEIQRVARGGFNHLTIGHNFSDSVFTKALGTQQSAGGQTDKAIAAKAFAADHGFEQKTVFAAVFVERQFQIKRQRGFQIGKRLGHHGNPVIALRP